MKGDARHFTPIPVHEINKGGLNNQKHVSREEEYRHEGSEAPGKCRP